MLGIKLAPALSLAKKRPVGGAVGGAMETITFNESLKKDRGVTVLRLPVVRKLLCDATEDARGEIARTDPGKDKEASIVDHQMETLFSLLRSPSDELVAGGRPSRRQRRSPEPRADRADRSR